VFTVNFTMNGDCPTFVLPKEVADRFSFSPEVQVRAIESPAGLLLCRADEETAKQLEVALDVMDRRRDALRRLAE
jgi:hypothetical protein